MSAKREALVTKRLMRLLEPHFEVAPQVPGSWPLDDRPLRLDLLVRPKDAALELGFDIPAFGIEVKDPESKESVSKLLDCVMQAYTYGFCEFDGERPAFVLIYPNVEKFFEYDFVNKYKNAEQERPGRRELRLLRRLMQRANVGELNLLTGGAYEFRFEGGRFYDSVRGRSGIKGLGMNRYVGSAKGRA